MPTATQPPRPLPPSDQQWIDPRTGKPTQTFYEYVKILDALVRALRTEIP
jgi:hypothetical protein